MEWFWWVALLVVLAMVSVPVVQYVIGRSIGIADTGRMYLSHELKKMGVRHLFPNQLIIEVADFASNTGATMARMGGQSQMTAKTEMISSIDNLIQQIAMWLKGDPWIKKQQWFSETMTKYGIPFGAVKKTPV